MPSATHGNAVIAEAKAGLFRSSQPTFDRLSQTAAYGGMGVAVGLGVEVGRGVAVGTAVGVAGGGGVGVAVGAAVGVAVGGAVGVAGGGAVGVALGDGLGVVVGSAVGVAVGTAVGVSLLQAARTAASAPSSAAMVTSRRGETPSMTGLISSSAAEGSTRHVTAPGSRRRGRGCGR